MNDPHPGMIHAFDQLGAASRPVAGWSHEFFQALWERGFDESQAMEILLVWSEAMAWRILGVST